MIVGKAEICNWALNDIGHFATFSIDGDDELSGSVELCWQRCVDFCIGLDDWHDFRKTFRLVRAANRPENGWEHEFSLPSGRIGEPLKILESAGQSPRPLRYFDREENSVFANVEQCWARCKVYRNPENWDPYWRSAFTVALSSLFASSIIQHQTLAEEKWQKAFGTPSREGSGGLFGRLMAQNKAGAPLGSPIIADEPLGLARNASSGPWYGGGGS